MMAYYTYKEVRDILIENGLLDLYGNPEDKERYGKELETGYNGNQWQISADYMKDLKQQNSKLTADNAALVEALEGCVCDLMNRDGEMPSTATGWAAEAIKALRQAKGDV